MELASCILLAPPTLTWLLDFWKNRATFYYMNIINSELGGKIYVICCANSEKYDDNTKQTYGISELLYYFYTEYKQHFQHRNV
jgi:hypothetical protein